MNSRKISEITRNSNVYRLLYKILFTIFIVYISLNINANRVPDLLNGVAGCAVWLFLMSWTYSESFLIINNNWSETGVSQGIHMSRLAQVHSFDHNEYFSHVAGRIIPGTAALMILSALSCIFLYTGENKTELLINLMALIPLMTFAGISARKKMFINTVCQKKGISKYDGMTFVINLISFVSVIWYIMRLLITLFIMLPLGAVPFSDIDSLCVPAYQIATEVPIGVPLGICTGLTFFVLLGTVIFRKHSKFFAKAGDLALLAVLIAAGAGIWLNTNFHSVRTTTESITVCDKGQKTEYLFDDVRRFRFYYSEEINGPQISVYTDDGKVFTLMDSTAVLSDSFFDYFDSPSEFAEYVVLQMADAGAEYQISHIEEIRNSAGHRIKNVVYPETIDSKTPGIIDELKALFSDDAADVEDHMSEFPAKPVIYIYPEETTDVSVKLHINETGHLTYTYPQYDEDKGWNVTAEPGSVLYDETGREYSYLFWEGVSEQQWDMETGFVVKGSDTVSFLQEKLEYLGLTPREYNEFIVYWMPKMQDNEYNLISFQTDKYEEYAALEITPEPDSIQRVFMAYRPLDGYEEIPEQVLEPFERHGYSVIEWGGVEIR